MVRGRTDRGPDRRHQHARPDHRRGGAGAPGIARRSGAGVTQLEISNCVSSMNGSEKQRWWAVVIFATAMAWLEAAGVLYLRTLVNRIDPYQARPLTEMPGLVLPEIIREAATIIMLTAVGWLAGRN